MFLSRRSLLHSFLSVPLFSAFTYLIKIVSSVKQYRQTVKDESLDKGTLERKEHSMLSTQQETNEEMR